MADAKRKVIAALVGSLFAAAAMAGGSGIRSGERLSDWILRQHDISKSYLPGLSWGAPEQKLPQARMQQQLLDTLIAAPDFPVSADIRRRMTAWIETLPVTGRVALAVTDPRWLQAHPEADPVLQAGQSVQLPRRTNTVTVVNGSLQRCTLPHRAGAETATYLLACFSGDAFAIDRVWLIQPDGHVLNLAVAAWNREAQSEPAPGALIWAPERDSEWPAWFSTRLAQFLASQEPGFAEQTATLATIAPAAPPGPDKDPTRARSRVVSANDWGLIGLLQTPTARMADAGDMRFSYSHVYPYSRGNIIFQPLDWLEAGFRYTAISNQSYGPGVSQSYKDKSIDVKFRLAKETASTPELALGLTDAGGTGKFASEYLVANKRWDNIDASLGLAWGYMGSRGNIRNPLSILSSGFKTRKAGNTGQGGKFSISEWFTGRASLFGGVQYHTPWNKNLTLKLELDGNDYKHEPFGYAPGAKSPVNAGFNYRLSDSVDLSAALERGNRLMLGFTFHGGIDKITVPKLLDPTPVPVRQQMPVKAPDWSKTVADIEDQTLWTISDISLRGKELCLTISKSDGVYWTDRIERAVRILHRDAPANVERFVLRHVVRGAPITEQVVLREPWLVQHIRFLLPSERTDIVTARRPNTSLVRETPVWHSKPEWFNAGLSPTFSQTVGGPDGFLLFQAGIGARSELKFNESTWTSGFLNLRLIDNYSGFKTDGPSDLPRVRTDLRKYLVTSRVTLPNLQVNHVGALSDTQYYSLYGGYLEPMFAGIGGEWLYRPWHSPFAFGVDVNHVKKRQFNQGLRLLDYSANTGHATVYWETGWHSIEASLKLGQYLAGDKGATIDVHRRFDNGTVMGALMTRTNVSAARFGEGSFDKGIYLSIPFDAILPRSSGQMANFSWHPLTRDGGAILDRAFTLFDFTRGRNRRMLSYRGPGNGQWNGEDSPMPDPDHSMFKDVGSSGKRLVTQIGSTPMETLLMGGGIVLASSLLDRPVSKWAGKHQGGKWDTMGKTANAIPIGLAVGTGLLWAGLGDEAASNTAWTAMKAAGLTFATEELTKLAVGRARPEANKGTFNFTGSSSGAATSGFPSQHMGVAFALVTPFAERYGANWLYAVAGATAFGRVQQQKHFVSDTVAGSLIGYGIGNLLLDQERGRNRPRISIGPDRTLRAYWEFD
ncbi:MAG: YjbH domain-containing protein [Georgfuchsia sp.]